MTVKCRYTYLLAAGDMKRQPRRRRCLCNHRPVSQIVSSQEQARAQHVFLCELGLKASRLHQDQCLLVHFHWVRMTTSKYIDAFNYCMASVWAQAAVKLQHLSSLHCPGTLCIAELYHAMHSIGKTA